MGYRSEVKIVAGKNTAKELLAVNAKHELFNVTEGDNDEWLFEADWLKWYEDEPDVAAYVEVIEKFEVKTGRDDGLCFLRLGEDDTDVEFRSNGGTYADLSHTIMVNGFTPKKSKPKAKK